MLRFVFVVLTSFLLLSTVPVRAQHNLRGMKKMKKCDWRAYQKASNIMNKCAPCTESILSANALLEIGFSPSFLNIKKCSPNCCARIKIINGVTHSIACYKGCCARISTLNIVDLNTPDQNRFVFRSAALINNENTVSSYYLLSQVGSILFRSNKRSDFCSLGRRFRKASQILDEFP